MNIKVKKNNPNAILPTFASSAAAGCDLYACLDNFVEIPPLETVKISTGLSMAIPDGYWGGIFARSGLATKEGLRPANSVGVIDSDYRGEIIVAVHNDTEYLRIIEPGQRIAQMLILPKYRISFEEVKELDSTDRGTGGFGSTGK